MLRREPWSAKGSSEPPGVPKEGGHALRSEVNFRGFAGSSARLEGRRSGRVEASSEAEIVLTQPYEPRGAPMRVYTSGEVCFGTANLTEGKLRGSIGPTATLTGVEALFGAPRLLEAELVWSVGIGRSCHGKQRCSQERRRSQCFGRIHPRLNEVDLDRSAARVETRLGQRHL